ncbi:MAG: hypothetical protein VX619_01215 [bacterium]|nr:hypothetical protein [bacterium]
MLDKFKVLVEKKDFDNARKKLEDYLKTTSEGFRNNQNADKLFSYYYFHLSLHEWRRGNLKIASLNMDRALSKAPENIEIQKARAQLYIESNQLSDAQQIIESFITKLNPSDRRNFNFKLATLMIKKEMLYEALQILRNHQLNFPKHLAALIELANLYLKLEQYQYAIDTFTILINLEPSEQFYEGLRKAKHGLEVSLRTVHSYSASFKIRIEGEHFENYYPIIFEELENCSSELNAIFGYEPRGLVHILFLNNIDFQKWNHLSNYVRGLSDGASWQIRIPINRVQNFKDKNLLINTLYHEYSHHLVRLITKGRGEIPIWFHEGLAKFLEPNRDHDKEAQVLRKLLEINQLFKPGQIPNSFGMHSKSYEAYIQSVSIVDYLNKVKCLDDLIASLSEFTEGTKFSDKLIEKCIMNEDQLIDQWTKSIQKEITEKNSEY